MHSPDICRPAETFHLACRASLNDPCLWDSPHWHNCFQYSLKNFAPSVHISLKTGLYHRSNTSNADKSWGWVHQYKPQTSYTSDVLKAPAEFDREPDAWKGEVSEVGGIHLPQDCFSPSNDQDNLEAAGLSYKSTREKNGFPLQRSDDAIQQLTSSELLHWSCFWLRETSLLSEKLGTSSIHVLASPANEHHNQQAEHQHHRGYMWSSLLPCLLLWPACTATCWISIWSLSGEGFSVSCPSPAQVGRSPGEAPSLPIGW